VRYFGVASSRVISLWMERTKVLDICHTPVHAPRPPDNEAVDRGWCQGEEGQGLLHSSCPFIIRSLELIMGSVHNTKKFQVNIIILYLLYETLLLLYGEWPVHKLHTFACLTDFLFSDSQA